MRHKIYILLFLIVLFSSCQSSFVEEKEEDIMNSSKTFSFIGIEYVYDSRTSIREYTTNSHPIVIENNTSIAQYYDDVPAKRMVESVHFYSNHPLAFSFESSEIFVKIPVNVMGDNTFLYDDGNQWIYLENEQENEFDKSIFCRTIEITPASRLTVISYYQYRDISTYYKLHLKGVEKGEDLIIDGFFTWTTFLNYNADFIIDSM